LGLKPALPEKNSLLEALGGISPERHVLSIIERIRSSDLDEALIVLPYSKCIILLEVISTWARLEWNVALTSRILYFIVKTYHNQIVTNRSGVSGKMTMRSLLANIHRDMRSAIQRQRDLVGYNVAAMKFMKRMWEQENVVTLDDEFSIQ
jgi:U3 small nucleolar RNA-associated protein 12